MNEPRATRYQRLRRRAAAAGLVSAAIVLTAVALTAAGTGLAALADAAAAGLSEPFHTVVALPLFVTFLVLMWEAATLPAMLYLSRAVERRYSGSQLSVEDILLAQLRGAAVAVPAALGAGAIVLLGERLLGRWWWIGAAVGLAGARALLAIAIPELLARLASVRPLARPALVERLRDLAARARVSVAGVYEWSVDLATTSALVSGAGPSRRIYIASALARDWSDEELAVVVAHELAHEKYRDVWWTVAIDAAVIGVAMAMAAAMPLPGAPVAGRAAELARLPVIAIVAGAVWLAATPLRHAQSRRQERRADVFALSLTGEAAAFGAAIRRLSDRHLAEERPSRLVRWFFHRHPSVTERLALAEAYQRVRAGS